MLADKLQIVAENRTSAVAICDKNYGDISYSELWSYINATCTEIDKKFNGSKYFVMSADQDTFAVIAAMSVILSGRIIIPIDPRLDESVVLKMTAPYADAVYLKSNTNYKNMPNSYSIADLVKNDMVQYNFGTDNSDAYILHTSGTTGKPKAVLARQDSLMKVSTALIGRYHLSTNSKVVQFSYMSFDSSLIEIWSTLLSGGTLVIPGPVLRDNLYGCLNSLLIDEQINVATLPSAVAEGLSEKAVSNFDTLILAGDELPAALCNRFRPLVKHLINAYGPTESVICATTYEVIDDIFGRVPIGEPLPGMNIIFEEDVDVGEMLLSSSYLAEGYPHDQQLTTNKFLYSRDGHRYYKSGDLGRLREDGFYEFIGRVDNQIKINGQRLELEGVESQLRYVSNISKLAVINIDASLVCIYESSEKLLEYEEMKLQLANHLPTYAIPTRYIAVKSLPLDANGKISRKELVSYGAEIITKPHLDTVPLEIENSKLITIWSKVLDVDQNTIDQCSSFFQLGGDSLSALKLLQVVNEEYNLTLKLSELIKSPATIESMNVLIAERLKTGSNK